VLSIIIPTHNSNENLSVLIKALSVIEKDKLEIIIVDDCGDEDASVFHHEEKSIFVTRLHENKGAGFARNVGLSSAKGEYVTFVDADDALNVTNLTSILAAIKPLHGRDIFYFSPQSHKPDGSSGRRNQRYKDLIDLYLLNKDESLRYRFHVPWSKIYNRAFLTKENILFDEVIASNDVIFSLKTGLRAKKIFVSEQSFYSVQEHTSGLTVQDTLERLKARLDVVVRYNTLLGLNGRKDFRICLLPLLLRVFKTKKSYLLKYLLLGDYIFLRDIIPTIKTLRKVR